MKDRCLFSIHKRDYYKDGDVVEFGVPNSSKAYNCIELWERPDGKKYLRVCGESFDTDYDWETIIMTLVKINVYGMFGLPDETFEEYCQRKSMLGSVYGSTNKEDTDND